jgi:hypothetical protein
MAKSNKITMLETSNPDWELSQPPLPSYADYYGRREPLIWQQSGLDALLGVRYAGVVAPCGSGKGTLQGMSSVRDIVVSNFRQAQLIHGPQLHILESFVYPREYVIDGEVYEYVVGDRENLATGNHSDEAKADILERWLTSTIKEKRGGCTDKTNLRGLIMVCSNSLLVRVFDRMLARTRVEHPEERKAARRRLHSILWRTTYRPDENHHLMGTQNKEEADLLDDINGLARFYSFLFASPVKTSKVFYTTATPYRGDCK